MFGPQITFLTSSASLQIGDIGAIHVFYLIFLFLNKYLKCIQIGF